MTKVFKLFRILKGKSYTRPLFMPNSSLKPALNRFKIRLDKNFSSSIF